MKFNKAVLVNISDSHFDQNYWDQLDQLVEKRVSVSRDDPKLFDELKDCDCLLLGFQVPTGKDIFDSAPNLKMINILATAYGTVDLNEAAKRNIPVCNLAGYSTESVAEFTIAAILHEIRQIEEGRNRAKAGNYDFDGMSARELKESNFGVIGLGNIGNRVAELAYGFGAKVSYWSRAKKDAPFALKDVDQLLAESDFISVNVAETPETTNLLNDKNLKLVRPGTVIISTVPPEVVNIDALAERLKIGDITYITDHPDEMKTEDIAKLKNLKNCILYPAIAFISDEARINKQEIFIRNMGAFLEGTPQNKVN